jgi:hypothetical protein
VAGCGVYAGVVVAERGCGVYCWCCDSRAVAVSAALVAAVERFVASSAVVERVVVWYLVR